MAAEASDGQLVREAIQQFRVEFIEGLFENMTNDQRVEVISNLGRVWCRHCGNNQPDRLGGCRCNDDS